jgi:hypothetical protein
MRPQPNASLFELFIESVDTILEPSVLDRNPQTTEALLEQLLVRQLFPGIFPVRHRPLKVITNQVLGMVS